MAFLGELLTLRRSAAYIYFGIGALGVIVSLIVLAVIPSASALPGVPTWLSALIPATLFLLAGGIERHGISRA